MADDPSLNELVQETYDYFQENGTALDENVILAPDDDAGWAQIRIVALQDDGSQQLCGILELADILEKYGGDVVAAKTEVLADIEKALTSALSSIGTKQAAAESALEDKETALEGSLDTYTEGLKPELQAYVDEAEGQAQLATQKANEAGGKADDAEASKDEAALLLTQIQALKAQIEALSQSKVVAPAMVEGTEMGITLTVYGGSPYLALSEIETVDEEETA